MPTPSERWKHISINNEAKYIFVKLEMVGKTSVNEATCVNLNQYERMLVGLYLYKVSRSLQL